VAGQGDAPLKGDGPHGDLFVSINVRAMSIYAQSHSFPFFA
jgi:DnaJ-class molecular chaperone